MFIADYSALSQTLAPSTRCSAGIPAHFTWGTRDRRCRGFFVLVHPSSCSQGPCTEPESRVSPAVQGDTARWRKPSCFWRSVVGWTGPRPPLRSNNEPGSLSDQWFRSIHASYRKSWGFLRPHPYSLAFRYFFLSFYLSYYSSACDLTRIVWNYSHH